MPTTRESWCTDGTLMKHKRDAAGDGISQNSPLSGTRWKPSVPFERSPLGRQETKANRATAETVVDAVGERGLEVNARKERR